MEPLLPRVLLLTVKAESFESSCFPISQIDQEEAPRWDVATRSVGVSKFVTGDENRRCFFPTPQWGQRESSLMIRQI